MRPTVTQKGMKQFHLGLEHLTGKYIYIYIYRRLNTLDYIKEYKASPGVRSKFCGAPDKDPIVCDVWI